MRSNVLWSVGRMPQEYNRLQYPTVAMPIQHRLSQAPSLITLYEITAQSNPHSNPQLCSPVSNVPFINPILSETPTFVSAQQASIGFASPHPSAVAILVSIPFPLTIPSHRQVLTRHTPLPLQLQPTIREIKAPIPQCPRAPIPRIHLLTTKVATPRAAIRVGILRWFGGECLASQHAETWRGGHTVVVIVVVVLSSVTVSVVSFATVTSNVVLAGWVIVAVMNVVSVGNVFVVVVAGMESVTICEQMPLITGSRSSARNGKWP